MQSKITLILYLIFLVFMSIMIFRNFYLDTKRIKELEERLEYNRKKEIDKLYKEMKKEIKNIKINSRYQGLR